MTTEKQLKANQANSKRSTGPKTAAGKRRVSQNSQRHGILSETAVIRGMESPAKWKRLVAALYADLKPTGFVAEVLVDRIAWGLWRLERVRRWENTIIAVAGEEAKDSVDDLVLRDNLIVTPFKEILSSIESFPDMPEKRGDMDFTLVNMPIGFIMDMMGSDDQALLWPLGPNGPTPMSPRFTHGMFRDALQSIMDHQQISADDLKQEAISKISSFLEIINDGRAKAVREFDRSYRQAPLQKAEQLGTVQRYERHLLRVVYEASHELERLQARRERKEKKTDTPRKK